MDRSKIEPTLAAQFDTLRGLLPAKLQKPFTETCYFAGGCIYSLWNDQPPKDYDVFCTSKVFLRSLTNWFKATGGAKIITDYAISFSPEGGPEATKTEYQFITAFVGEPEDVVGEFDFLHNMFWWSPSAGLQCHALSNWERLDSPKLIFNKARGRDAASTLTRVPKFVARGMTISRTEMAKIVEKTTTFPNVIVERRAIKQWASGRRKGY